MKRLPILPVLFIIGCAGTPPPPPLLPTKSEIICDNWIVWANNPQKITGTERGVSDFKNFLVRIGNFLGDKHKITDIDFLIKDSNDNENLIALAPDKSEQDGWVIESAAEREKYEEIINAAQDDYLYTTLRIHYRDERNNFSGIFYAKPALLSVRKKEASKSNDATLTWGRVSSKFLSADEEEGFRLRLWVKYLSARFLLFDQDEIAKVKIYKLTDIDNSDLSRGLIKFKSGSFHKTIYQAQNENPIELAEIVKSIHENLVDAKAVATNDIAFIVKGTASKKRFKADSPEKELANFVNERCFHWNEDTRDLVLAPLNVAGKDYGNERLPELRAIQTGKFLKEAFAAEIEDIGDRVFPVYGEPEGDEDKDEEIHRRIDLYFVLKPKLYQASKL